jgi:hypothetical protein
MALPPAHVEIARWKSPSSSRDQINLVLWRYEGRYETFGSLRSPTELIDLGGPVRASNDRQAIALVEAFNRERSIRRVEPLPGVEENCACGHRVATNPNCPSCSSYRRFEAEAEAQGIVKKLGALLERNPPQDGDGRGVKVGDTAHDLLSYLAIFYADSRLGGFDEA